MIDARFSSPEYAASESCAYVPTTPAAKRMCPRRSSESRVNHALPRSEGAKRSIANPRCGCCALAVAATSEAVKKTAIDADFKQRRS